MTPVAQSQVLGGKKKLEESPKSTQTPTYSHLVKINKIDYRLEFFFLNCGKKNNSALDPPIISFASSDEK